MHMTARLSTEQLSFSAEQRSSEAPKSVQITRWRLGSPIVMSTLRIWLRHWYCAQCSLQVTSRLIKRDTTILTGNLVLPNSSWVFCLPLFSPCQSACIHSKQSTISLHSPNNLHVDICSNPSTPHSSHVLFTQSHLSNLGILRLLPIPHASNGLDTKGQHEISTRSSTRLFR